MNKVKKILLNQSYTKYLKNTSWAFGDKIINLFFVFITNIIVARYLGPESFGIIAYAMALISIFSVATHLGLVGIVVKDIVTLPSQTHEILGTVFYLKLFSSLIAFFILFLIALLTEELFTTNFYILLITSFIILLKPFEVIEFWFNAKIKLKYSSLAKILSQIVSSIFKILLVLLSMNIIWFAFANLFQFIIITFSFVYIFKKYTNIELKHLSFSSEKAKMFFKRSWPLMLGTLFTLIYLKIDILMINHLLNSKQAGIYSVASSLSEIWYFIPTILVSSLFPKIVELKNKNNLQYKKRLQQFYDLLFILSIVIAILTTIFAEGIINQLYGKEYIESSYVLQIHIWAGIFIFLRALFSNWIILENIVIFSLITQGIGCIINVLLNLFMIPKYGIIGAAYATLISYAIASYFSLLIHKSTREAFYMMSKSFFTPIKYIINTKGSK